MYLTSQTHRVEKAEREREGERRRRQSPVSDEFSRREQSLYVPAVAY